MSSNPKSNVHNYYKILYNQELGKGASGRVVKAIRKRDQLEVAVKVIQQESLSSLSQQHLVNEVSALKRLSHENIIRLYDVYEDKFHFYVVLELIKGGELFDRIAAKTCYNECEARDLCRCILNALNYCHSCNIVHRDLKAENLLMLSHTDNSSVKLCDFGFSGVAKNDTSLSGFMGTPIYMAPEIWVRNGSYGKPIDMWSFGVLSYIILVGYPPFFDTSEKGLEIAISQAAYTFHDEDWSNISSEAKDFIQKLIVVDPSKRMTTTEALKHQWLQVPDHALLSRDLNQSAKRLKVFNAKKKIKAVIHTIIAVKRMKRTLDQSVTAAPLPISMVALTESLIDSKNSHRAISVDDLQASTQILLQQDDIQLENQRGISVNQVRTSVFNDDTNDTRRLTSTDSRLSKLTGQDLIIAPSKLEGVIILHGHFKWLNRFVIVENGIFYFYAKPPNNPAPNDKIINSDTTGNAISRTNTKQACLKEIHLYLYTVAANDELELVLLGRSSKTANIFMKCADSKQITNWTKLIEQHICYSMLMKREENRIAELLAKNNYPPRDSNSFTSQTSTIPSNDRNRPVRSLPHSNSVMRISSSDDSSVYSAAFRDSNMTPDNLPDTNNIRYSDFESRPSSLNAPNNQYMDQSQNFIPFSAAQNNSFATSSCTDQLSNSKTDVNNASHSRNLDSSSNSIETSSSETNSISRHTITNPLHEKLIENSSFEVGNSNIRVLKGSVLMQELSCLLPFLSCYTAIPRYLVLDQTSLKLYRQLITNGIHDEKEEIEIMINQCDVSICHFDSTKFRITAHSKQSFLGIFPYPGRSYIIKPVSPSDSNSTVKEWIQGIEANIKFYE